MLIQHGMHGIEIVEAVMLSKLLANKGAVVRGNDEHAFFSEEHGDDWTIDTATLRYGDVEKKYANLFHLPPGWDHKSRRILCNELGNASRFSSPDRYSVVRQGALEALENGPVVVTTASSDIGYQIKRRARAVCGEQHRVISFMRMDVYEDEKLLVGRYTPEHHTEDLVLAHFKRRFPDYDPIAITPNATYSLSHISEERILAIHKSPTKKEGDDEALELWRTFYDSQYLESRRNRPLAVKCVPKKFWYLVDESHKLDHGIAGTTLDDF